MSACYEREPTNAKCLLVGTKKDDYAAEVSFYSVAGWSINGCTTKNFGLILSN